MTYVVCNVDDGDHVVFSKWEGSLGVEFEVFRAKVTYQVATETRYVPCLVQPATV